MREKRTKLWERQLRNREQLNGAEARDFRELVPSSIWKDGNGSIGISAVCQLGVADVQWNTDQNAVRALDR